jgi:hypothetical protein
MAFTGRRDGFAGLPGTHRQQTAVAGNEIALPSKNVTTTQAFTILYGVQALQETKAGSGMSSGGTATSTEAPKAPSGAGGVTTTPQVGSLMRVHS